MFSWNGISFPAVLAIAVLLAQPRTASAHALGAEAKLKDGHVHVEGYYEDDTPAASARISVENEAKEKVAEGRADARGRWSFPAPAPGRYRVTVDAGSGHRAVVAVTIPGQPPAPGPTANPTESGTPPSVTPTEEARVSAGPTREEFTSIPWLRIAIGLVLLGLIAFGLPRLRRALRNRVGATKEGAA